MRDNQNKIRKIVREELRKVVSEDFNVGQAFGTKNIVKSDNIEDQFIVVFTPKKSDFTLQDVITKTNFSGYYNIAAGNKSKSFVVGRPVGIYSLDDKKEAVEYAREILNEYS